MRLGRVATQWVTVLVLLLILAVINHYRPDLVGFDIDSQRAEKPGRFGGDYDAIDGDSFRAGRTEVRLHGIDAPEYRQTCDGNPCGRMARDALSKLIRGQNVSCKILEQDRYGRQVSVCRDGETEINREMVRLGWAIAYRKHSRAYIAAEDEARKSRRGIWQWRFEKPEEYRARNRPVEGGFVGAGDED
jgi:endonuclease YncB( thermonuclease family)